MGGAKRNPGSETLRGEAPDAEGAQENNRMLTPLQQSPVWRRSLLPDTRARAIQINQNPPRGTVN